MYAKWDSSAVVLDWRWAVVSAIPLFVGAGLQGVAWVFLVQRMAGKTVPWGPAMLIYVESQLARYTPGKVGLPLVRIAGAPRLGVAAVTVGSSVFLELLSWLASGGSLGFGLLMATRGNAEGALAALGQLAFPLLGGFVVIVALLLAVDRRYIPSSIVRRFGLDGEGPLAPPGLPFVQLLYWGTWALHGYFAGLAVGATSVEAQAASGLFILAPIAGFIALAAPAGVGVREAVLSVGLAPAVGPASAVAAAAISRGASLVADLGSWLLLRVVVRAPRDLPVRVDAD
jgi:hypothetical protein